MDKIEWKFDKNPQKGLEKAFYCKNPQFLRDYR